MAGIKYPVRVKIVSVDEERLPGTSWTLTTPEISRPHIGKCGTAHSMSDAAVVVVLDDGTLLYGSECWWEPLP